jgi:uncharacterized protein (TIGR03437 family)
MALPTITGVAPAGHSPYGGDNVVITGTNFTSLNVTAVTFGGTPATSFHIDSGTQITAVSPRKVGINTVDITVTNPSGTSATSGADQFTYDSAWATPAAVERDENPTSPAAGAFTTKAPVGLYPIGVIPVFMDYPLLSFVGLFSPAQYAAGGGVSLL